MRIIDFEWAWSRETQFESRTVAVGPDGLVVPASHQRSRRFQPWPALRHRGIYHGFAGGLSAENVTEQIEKIADTVTAGGLPFWLDMEGRVRTDEELDLVKVRRVLESCAPLIHYD
jgi:hypothetical protein